MRACTGLRYRLVLPRTGSKSCGEVRGAAGRKQPGKGRHARTANRVGGLLGALRLAEWEYVVSGPDAMFVTAHQPCFGRATANRQMVRDVSIDRVEHVGCNTIRYGQMRNHRRKGARAEAKALRIQDRYNSPARR